MSKYWVSLLSSQDLLSLPCLPHSSRSDLPPLLAIMLGTASGNCVMLLRKVVLESPGMSPKESKSEDFPRIAIMLEKHLWEQLQPK